MYQCPGVTSLGGGAWGYYGCQTQIASTPTCLEIEWDPKGPLGGVNIAAATRELGREGRQATARLTSLVHEAAPEAREALTAATLSVLKLFDGLIAVDAIAKDLAVVAAPDEQELCSAIDGVLSSLEEGPHVVSLEEKLGSSRRTVLRRTQSLCKRYLLPGLAADDWRSVRDSYRLLIGAIFATHPSMTTRALAAMLGYASPEALCHAFANAGLSSPATLREQAAPDMVAGLPLDRRD